MSDLKVAFSNMALKSNMTERSGGGSGSTSRGSPVASQLAPGRQFFPLPTTTSSSAPITSLTTTAWSGTYLSGPVTSTCHSNSVSSASAYLYAGQNVGYNMSAGLEQSSALSSTVAPIVSSSGLQRLPPPSWRKGILDYSIFFEMFLFILKRFQTLTVCSPALSSGALEKINCRSLVFNYIILLCLRY